MSAGAEHGVAVAAGRVRLELDGPVAWLRVDNPSKMNAMSLAMWESIAAHAADIGERREVRVVVLRGEGGRAFVSGADISEFESRRGSAEATERYNRAVGLAQSALERLPKPVVAAIEGVCMGGGIGLALSCDLRIAREGTRFRMPAARLGLGYGVTEMQRVVEVLGRANAADIFMTARTFDEREALRLGLVNAWHAHASFEAELLAFVERVAGNAPLTLRAAKLAIAAANRSLAPEQRAALDLAVGDCFASADYVEGRRAFMEKRPPRFTGS